MPKLIALKTESLTKTQLNTVTATVVAIGIFSLAATAGFFAASLGIGLQDIANNEAGLVQMATVDTSLPVISGVFVDDIRMQLGSTVTIRFHVEKGTATSLTYNINYGRTVDYGSSALAKDIWYTETATGYNVSAQITVAPATLYHFQISVDAGNLGVVKSADYTFTTPPLPDRFIRVLAPNGGEVLHVGETYRIRWDSAKLNSDIIISIMSAQAGRMATITSKAPNVGYYDWTVAQNQIDYVGKNNLKIQLLGYEIGVGQAYDYSDDPFNIESVILPTISNVQATDITAESATISFHVEKGTATSTSNQIYYGVTTAYGSIVGDSGIIRYNQTSTGYDAKTTTTIQVSPDTLYHYQVVITSGSDTIRSADYTFTTLVLPSPTVTFSQPAALTLVYPGIPMQVTWAGTGFSDTETGYLYLYNAITNTMVYNPYQDYINRGMVIDGWNLYLKGGSFNPTLRKDLAYGSYKFIFKRSSVVVGESPVFTVTSPYFSDGGFEQGIGAWTAWYGTASVSRDTADKYAGTASFKWVDADKNLNNTASYRNFTNINDLKGKTINISFRYKIDAFDPITSAPLIIGINRNGTGGGWSQFVVKRYPITTWTYVNQNLIIPSDATFISLFIYKGNWYTTATVHLDDVNVKVVNATCGNSLVEAGETCDQGSTYNGQPGYCDKYCSGTEPRRVTLEAERGNLINVSEVSWAGASGTAVNFIPQSTATSTPTQVKHSLSSLTASKLYTIWLRQYRPSTSSGTLNLWNSDHTKYFLAPYLWWQDSWAWIRVGSYTPATFTTTSGGAAVIIERGNYPGNYYYDQIMFVESEDFDPQYPR